MRWEIWHNCVRRFGQAPNSGGLHWGDGNVGAECVSMCLMADEMSTLTQPNGTGI